MVVILAPRRLTLEDHEEFKASLGYIARPVSKKKKKKRIPKGVLKKMWAPPPPGMGLTQVSDANCCQD
jgi:hypothetical protein